MSYKSSPLPHIGHSTTSTAHDRSQENDNNGFMPSPSEQDGMQDHTHFHAMAQIIPIQDIESNSELERPPYIQAMLAGGIGGTMGDMLMHSLDTVKTRQQGDPHWPPRYTSLSDAYMKILRQEGVRRGLYGGFSAAMLGSFPGTVLFFGAYEFSKRTMLDYGINPSVAYLASGFSADLVASVLYVPSEVLKTRLQLQGRFNNPAFYSGYNYRGTLDAARTIVRVEGATKLYSGYKATIVRDMPFSAIQFAVYEQSRNAVALALGTSNIGWGLEILTAVSAGGIAGAITCPLDVVKTRIQTQIRSENRVSRPRPSQIESMDKAAVVKVAQKATQQKRMIHNHVRTVPATVPALDTGSVIEGLRIMYKYEGLGGWFRGVGPRVVWTSVQSGTMLVMYQYLLKQFDRLGRADEHRLAVEVL